MFVLELEKLEKQRQAVLPGGLGAERPTSGVSVISEDVEKFEQDMKSWLAVQEVSSPSTTSSGSLR